MKTVNNVIITQMAFEIIFKQKASQQNIESFKDFGAAHNWYENMRKHYPECEELTSQGVWESIKARIFESPVLAEQMEMNKR